MLPCSGWSPRASEEGSALLGAKTSDRSCAVFFCSGRSAGTCCGVCASTTASPDRPAGEVFGSWAPAERVSRMSPPATTAKMTPVNSPRLFHIRRPPFGKGRLIFVQRAHHPLGLIDRLVRPWLEPIRPKRATHGKYALSVGSTALSSNRRESISARHPRRSATDRSWPGGDCAEPRPLAGLPGGPIDFRPCTAPESVRCGVERRGRDGRRPRTRSFQRSDRACDPRAREAAWPLRPGRRSETNAGSGSYRARTRGPGYLEKHRRCGQACPD